MIKKVCHVVMLFCVGSIFSACEYEEKPYVEKPLSEIYTSAYGHMMNESYEDAADEFDEVERQYPYSSWAAKAQLLSAYCAYKDQKFSRAISTLDIFIVFHPSSPYIEYAYYLRGMAYYTDILPVFRDREAADLALQAFHEVVRRFPNTEYAYDASLKIDFVLEHLASQEMFIAKNYLKEKEYVAAIRRFGGIVTTYPKSTLIPEVLFRIVECQISLGLFKSAKRTLAVLGYNFPQSLWYDLGYKLFASVKPSMISPKKPKDTTATAAP